MSKDSAGSVLSGRVLSFIFVSTVLFVVSIVAAFVATTEWAAICLAFSIMSFALAMIVLLFNCMARNAKTIKRLKAAIESIEQAASKERK